LVTFFFFTLAPSPIPPTTPSSSSSSSNLQQTKKQSLDTLSLTTAKKSQTKEKKSRHTRNSSAGHIPNTTTITFAANTNKPKMQRRRSFDGTEKSSTQVKSSKLTAPMPISSVSARVTSPIKHTPTTNYHRGGITVPKINTTAVPFPRGGRQIGQSTVRRSNSIERNQFKSPEGNVCMYMLVLFMLNLLIVCMYLDQPPKKRHLFRFGKKKSK
jgi:hypothetical protein